MTDTPLGNFYPVISVSNTDKIILPAANRRRTITLYQTFNTTLTITFGSAATYQQGMVIITGTQPITFVRDSSQCVGIEVGSLIDQEVHAIAGGAGTVGAIVTYDP